MKTKIINSDCSIHFPENNDEYHVLAQVLESCGLEKNLNSICDESWGAWRFNPDGTCYLEFHSIFFNDMEQEG